MRWNAVANQKIFPKLEKERFDSPSYEGNSQEQDTSLWRIVTEGMSQMRTWSKNQSSTKQMGYNCAFTDNTRYAMGLCPRGSCVEVGND